MVITDSEYNLFASLGVGNKNIQMLKDFVDMVFQKNQQHNLIGKSTMGAVFSRHVLDSAQLLPFIDIERVRRIVDLGSGGGFPGIVLGILLRNMQGFLKIHLVEKSNVKAEFLIDVLHELGLKNVLVHQSVSNVEDISEVDLFTSRAFKPMPELFKFIAREISIQSHKLHQYSQDFQKNVQNSRVYPSKKFFAEDVGLHHKPIVKSNVDFALYDKTNPEAISKINNKTVSKTDTTIFPKTGRIPFNCLLLTGANINKEIEESLKQFEFEYKNHQSLICPTAYVTVVKNCTPI